MAIPLIVRSSRMLLDRNTTKQCWQKVEIQKDSMPPTAQNQVFSAQHRKTVPSPLVVAFVSPLRATEDAQEALPLDPRCVDIPAVAVLYHPIAFCRGATLVFQINNPNKTNTPRPNAILCKQLPVDMPRPQPDPSSSSTSSRIASNTATSMSTPTRSKGRPVFREYSILTRE